MLLNAGADQDREDAWGWAALMITSDSGHSELASFLRDHVVARIHSLLYKVPEHSVERRQ